MFARSSSLQINRTGANRVWSGDVISTEERQRLDRGFEMKCRMLFSSVVVLMLVAQTCSASERTVALQGIVEETFFRADLYFPVNSTLNFLVRYQDDPALNADRDPLSDMGVYDALSWDLIGQPSTPRPNSMFVRTTNGPVDSVSFTSGSFHLPTYFARGFGTGILTVTDPTGLTLDDDHLPQVMDPNNWQQGTFNLKWSGADGMIVRGRLRVVSEIVPEPSLLAFIATFPLLLVLRRKRTLARNV